MMVKRKPKAVEYQSISLYTKNYYKEKNVFEDFKNSTCKFVFGLDIRKVLFALDILNFCQFKHSN